MNVGPSGVVYVPITDISPIDCGKLAETYRHLKANFDKRKFPLGHKMGTTGATHQPGRCEEDSPYNSWTINLYIYNFIYGNEKHNFISRFMMSLLWQL